MHRYGERYIESDEFLKYYDKVAAGRGKSHDLKPDKKELEFWEEHSLLLPALRMVLPDDYVRDAARCREKYLRNEPSEFPPSQWPEEWKGLAAFRRRLTLWSQPRLEELEHPLDMQTGQEAYFLLPSEHAFREWNTYRARVELDDRESFPDSADHYYHYWQVHLLDAVRRENTMTVIANLRAENPFDGMRNGLLPANRLRSSASFGYVAASGQLRQITSAWNVLSKHVIFESRLQEALRSSGASEDNPRINERCQRYAEEILQAASLSEDDWREFMKTLCHLWVEYKEHDRLGLASELRHDVKWACRVAELAYGTDEAQLREIIGHPNYGGWSSHVLTMVLDNEIEDDRHRFKLMLRNYWPRTEASETVQSLATRQETLCNTIEQFDLWELYRAIGKGIWNDEPDSDDWIQNALGSVGNLAEALEEFVFQLGLHCSDPSVSENCRQADTGHRDLYNKLIWVFKKRPWWKDLENARFPRQAIPEDIVQKVTAIEQNTLPDIPVAHVSIVRGIGLLMLVRNYMVHNKQPNLEMYRTHYGTMCEGLMRVLVTIWTEYNVQFGPPLTARQATASRGAAIS